MRAIARTNIGIVAFLLAVLVSSYPAAADGDFIITATGGLTIPTGDIGEDLVGPGVVFGGLAHVGLTDRFYIGGGGHLGILGGQDFTDGGVVFTFEGGGVFYLVPRVDANRARPYIAGYVGFGGLAWSLEQPALFMDENGNLKTLDSDGNAFLFIAPEAGIDIFLSEYVSLVGGARFVIATYGDTTGEDVKFDIDGGHFVEFFLGLAFTL